MIRNLSQNEDYPHLAWLNWVLERDKKHQKIHSCWSTRKQTSVLQLGYGSHMARNCRWPWSPAKTQKENGYNCRKSNSSNNLSKLGREPWAPNENSLMTSTLIAGLWEPEQRIQLSHTQTLDPGRICVVLSL